MLQFSTLYDLHDSNHADVSTWRHRAPAKSWKTNAQHWARRYGEAKVLRGDGSVLRYWTDLGDQGQCIIRQRTYRHVIIQH